MPLADEVMNRYRSKGGGGGNPGPMAEGDETMDDEQRDAKVAAGKALLAAIKRGDAMAVCEAVKHIADEY